MTSKDLDQSIARLRQKPLPDCPEVLLQNVARKLRQQKSSQSIGPIEWLNLHIFDCGWSVPTMALTIALSTMTSIIAFNQTVDRAGLAANSLQINSIADSHQLQIFGTGH